MQRPEGRDGPGAGAGGRPRSQGVRPSIRVGSPLAASQLSSAAIQFPLAANGFPRAANRFPLAASQLSSAANRLSSAANGFPLAANRFSRGVNRFPPGANRFPRGVNRFPAGASRFSPAADESPLAAEVGQSWGPRLGQEWDHPEAPGFRLAAGPRRLAAIGRGMAGARPDYGLPGLRFWETCPGLRISAKPSRVIRPES